MIRTSLYISGREFRSIDRIDCRLVLTANCRNTRSIASLSNKILGIEKLKLKDDVIGEKPAFIIVKGKGRNAWKN